MKRLLIVGVFAIAGLAAFAGTCTITKIRLTKIGSNDTFAGQLNNNSGVNILQHNFVVAFLDSSNTVLETKTVPGCLRSVQDGEVDFFSATSSKPASSTVTGLARIAFDSAFKVGQTAEGDVTISSVNVRRVDGETALSVGATVKNNDSDTLVDPVACIVVFDSDDNVVFVKRVDIADLDEDESKAFDTSMTLLDDTDVVDHVDIYVDGLDGSSSAAPIAPFSKTAVSVGFCNTPTNTPTSTNTVAATNTPTETPTGTLTPPAATNTPVATNTPCP